MSVSPKDQREAQARRLRGKSADELQTTLTETTWIGTLGRAWAMLVGSVFLGGLLITMLIVFAVKDRMYDAAFATAFMVLLAVGSAACFAEFRYQYRNRPWVRLDSTGIACSRGNFLQKSMPAREHRWSECGPFEAKQRWRGGEFTDWVARCEVGSGTLSLRADLFGGVEDMVTILNAYRTAFTAGPATPDR